MHGNIALIRKYYMRLWDNKDLNTIDDFCDQNIKIYCSTGYLEYSGTKLLQERVKEWYMGFPDMKVVCDKLYVENNVVVCEWTTTLTHSGEFRGYMPTKKTFINKGKSFFKINNGKIIERKDEYDAHIFLREITSA